MEEKKLNDAVQLNKEEVEEVSGGGGFAGGNLGGRHRTRRRNTSADRSSYHAAS